MKMVLGFRPPLYIQHRGSLKSVCQLKEWNTHSKVRGCGNLPKSLSCQPREDLTSIEHILSRQRDCLNGKDYFSYDWFWWRIIIVTNKVFKAFQDPYIHLLSTQFVGSDGSFKCLPRRRSRIGWCFTLFVVDLSGPAVSLLASQSWNGACGHTLLALPCSLLFCLFSFHFSNTPPCCFAQRQPQTL